MNRIIPFAPSYTIDRGGEVRSSSKREKVVCNGTHRGRFGMTHLTVTLDEQRLYVWKLLSMVWFDGSLPLNRSGSLLRFDTDETFVFKIKPSSDFTDPEEILLIWHTYQSEKVPTWNLGEKGGLLIYSVDQYKRLITDILIASVR